MRSCFLVLAALLLAACNSGERQHLQLEELERQNRADSLMLNDSLARDLADWFDRHGTPNEQMRAYYILGRTYADRGEAPQAIAAYNDAADKADTTAADCDYAKLSRVYAQKAEVFYYQLLPDNMIHEERQAMRYAQMAKDTMQYLYCYGMLAEGYEMKDMPDSALILFLQAYQLYMDANANNLAAGLGCSIANIYVQKQDYQKAENFLREYEVHSGFFDDNGNVESGKELYYYFKGQLCLLTSKESLAEYYFSKLNAIALTFDQKIAALNGLQAFYQSNFDKDSLIKYSNLRDSLANIVHNEVAMQKTLQVQAMFDYSRSERIAFQKEKESDQLRFTLIISTAVIVILMLLTSLIYLRNRNAKKLLEEKIRILSGYAVNERLRNSSTAQHFYSLLKSIPYQSPAFADWKDLRNLIDQEIPTFYTSVNGGDNDLSEFEYDVCMLIKIQVPSSDIAKLKKCSPAYITQTRKRVYKKIFNKKGRADELDEYILSLS